MRLKLLNKQLMQELADKEDKLQMAEAFERNTSELLQTLKDDVERLLKDIEIKATKQISDDSAVFRRTVAVWYKQLLDTYDITDEKIGSIIDATEVFVAQITEKAEAITDALYDKAQPKFGKMVDSLNNAVKLYTKKERRIKRLVRLAAVSVVMSLLALAGAVYLIFAVL